MKHIMVDLETMGTTPGSVILSIGAVAFDPDMKEAIEPENPAQTFHQHISLKNSLARGFLTSADTTLWWMNQSEEARSNIIRGQVNAYGVSDTLSMYSSWVLQHEESLDEIVMWGNGASFDNALLSKAYEMVGMRQPWQFYNDRCYRTKKADYPNIKLVREGTHHNALHDAISQAKHLQVILQAAKGTPQA